MRTGTGMDSNRIPVKMVGLFWAFLKRSTADLTPLLGTIIVPPRCGGNITPKPLQISLSPQKAANHR